MSGRVGCVVLCVLLALTASGARAEPGEAQGVVVEFLKSLHFAPPARLVWDDSVTAAPAAGGDTVTVPGLRVVSDAITRLEIGTAVFGVSPAPAGAGKPRQRITVALPPALRLFDKDGASSAIVRAAENRFSGTWAPEYADLLDIDFACKEITVENAGGDPILSIGSLTGVTEGREDGTRWSGSLTLRVAALESPLGFRLDEASQTTRVANFSLPAMSELNRLSGVTSPGAGASPELDRKALAELVRALDRQPRLADAIAMAFRAGGLSVVTPQGEAVALDGSAFEISFAVKAADDAEIGISLALDGFATEMALPPIVPDRIGIATRLVGLPADRLWRLAVRAAEAAERDGDGAAGKVADEEMSAIVKEGKARLKLDLTLGGPTYSGVLASSIRVDEQSPHGASGEAQLAIAGLDETLAAISGQKDTLFADKAVAALTFLKAFGKPRSEKSGIVYDYAILVDSAGKLTVNGQDLSAAAGGKKP